MLRKILLMSVALLVITLSGCKTKPDEELDYNRELMPGEDALVRITDPAMIPDFSRAFSNIYGLQEAVDNSLNYMSKPSSQNFFPINGISHQKVVDSLNAFNDLLDSGYSAAQMNDYVRQHFDVYMSVGCDNRGTVLFTGYYTPIFNGSMEPDERFRYPLYSMPEGLVKNEIGETIGIETAGGQLVQCPPRSQIESSGIVEGKELIWLEDPFEVYIAHVQGSAKIRMADDSLVTVGYAATNGHEYQTITKELSASAGIPMDKMSLSAMIDYFSRNKDQVDRYVNNNPRYVFFRISEGNPTGSINEPVIRMRSIATDKAIFPRAALTFVDTKLPRNIGNEVVIYPYQGFFLDQDTGGAIRAPGRCDIYMGQGDDAGLVAGKTYEEGNLYYLILK